MADLFMNLNSMVLELQQWLMTINYKFLYCYIEPLSNQIATHFKTQTTIYYYQKFVKLH